MFETILASGGGKDLPRVVSFCFLSFDFCCGLLYARFAGKATGLGSDTDKDKNDKSGNKRAQTTFPKVARAPREFGSIACRLALCAVGESLSSAGDFVCRRGCLHRCKREEVAARGRDQGALGGGARALRARRRGGRRKQLAGAFSKRDDRGFDETCSEQVFDVREKSDAQCDDGRRLRRRGVAGRLRDGLRNAVPFGLGQGAARRRQGGGWSNLQSWLSITM